MNESKQMRRLMQALAESAQSMGQTWWGVHMHHPETGQVMSGGAVRANNRDEATVMMRAQVPDGWEIDEVFPMLTGSASDIPEHPRTNDPELLDRRAAWQRKVALRHAN